MPPFARRSLAQQIRQVAAGRTLRGSMPGLTIPWETDRGNLQWWGVGRGSNSPRLGLASASVARMARLEAVLFLAKEALPARRLAQLANLADGTEARTMLGELSRSYLQSGSAFAVEQVAEGYRLLVRPQFAQWVRQLTPGENDWKLTPPALDTLTVVAYRQPVLRAEIEAIRGVGSGELLRQLIERDLLRIVGRSSELGRPLLYGTTKRFLQTFGLRSLDDLPFADELRRGSQADSPSLGEPEATRSSKAA